MARILCYTLNPAFDLAVGVEHLQPGSVHRAGSSHMDPAGKGINVGRVLRRLGHAVRLGGLLGQDNAGPFHQLFRHEGMEAAFVEVPGATRINVKLAESGGRVTDINGPGLPIAAADWQRLLDAMPGDLKGVDAVVVSGSLPPGLSDEDFAHWLAALRGHALPVWVDTSGAGLQALRRSGATLLKPNEEELEQLLGTPLSDPARLREGAGTVLARGWAGSVLLSMGGQGASWFDGQTMLHATAPEVRVHNTVCAGDTLLAAALHGELGGWPRARSLPFAVALAAECVRHVGPGDPQAPDLPDLLAQVQLNTTPVPDPAPEISE